MQTHLICYADSNMSISQRLCTKSAKEVGKIDKVVEYSPHDIDPYFFKRYRNILEAEQRGGGRGYWLWKPYIVDDYIRKTQPGDILIYCDSGVEWVNSVYRLIDQLFTEIYEGENDIFLFSNGFRQIDWCKVEVMSKMFGVPGKWDYAGQGYTHYKQVQASVIIMRVNEYTREFASRWLAWSCIPGFIDDQLNATQLPEFREHRNDQSIITNLAIEDGIKLHWWPAQYGGPLKGYHPDDTYPQMFYHHRRRNEEWLIETQRLGLPIDQAIQRFMNQPKNI